MNTGDCAREGSLRHVETNSVTVVQHNYRWQCGKDPPSKPKMWEWLKNVTADIDSPLDLLT